MPISAGNGALPPVYPTAARRRLWENRLASSPRHRFDILERALNANKRLVNAGIAGRRAMQTDFTVQKHSGP